MTVGDGGWATPAPPLELDKLVTSMPCASWARSSRRHRPTLGVRTRLIKTATVMRGEDGHPVSRPPVATPPMVITLRPVRDRVGLMQLRDPAHHVSPRAIVFWTVRAVPGWLILLAVQLLWFLTSRDHEGLRVAALAVTVVLASAHLIVMPRWRYRVHRWEVTDNAVHTQSGWLSQERRIAPISRVQTVDTERGPLEQLFRLANVTVTTASAAGPLRIHGLDRATADGLVAQLTEITSRSQGDAT